MAIDWWIWWLGLGAILLVSEIFTLGFLLACFGLGSLAAIIPSLFGASLEWQIGTFIVVSTASLFTVRPLLMESLKRSQHSKETNVNAVIGKRGLITVVNEADRGMGRAQVGGDDWKIVTLEGQDLEEGKKIEVIAIDGSKLMVRPVGKKKEWL